MEAYHYVWLGAHPDRTEEWLKAKLAEGFDIHHLDEDHGNNAPGNLVLIEHVDHMRLHGTFGNRMRAAKSPLNGRKKPRTIEEPAPPSPPKVQNFPSWYSP